jgi:WD40 repeat protein
VTVRNNSAAARQGVSKAAADDKSAAPASTPGPISTEGLDRRLYVANDAGKRIDVYDVDDNHTFLRSIQLEGGLSRFRGITAHAPSNRLYVTDSSKNVVVALDLTTEKEVWRKKYTGANSCGNPDRLNVTVDGKALYVPCKDDDRYLILDAEQGNVIKKFAFDRSPHNTWAGEGGRYMYLTGYRNPTVQVWDTTTHTKVKDIGPFSAGVRPFAVDPQEEHLYGNLTPLLGFGQGDIETGRVDGEYEIQTPEERTRHRDAGFVGDELPHGGHPKSHGLAFRPGSDEVWFMDDGWGYLYVYDTSGEVPTHKATLPLFDDITQKWGYKNNRWVAFSIDGKYVYPSDGSVWDAETKTKLSSRIAPSEKQIEVDFEAGRPVQNSGQQGGVYAYGRADHFGEE